MDQEGNTSILSLQPEGLLSDTQKVFATPQATTTAPAYAPKWLYPKCGARFGFGNKLVTFGNSSSGLLKVNHVQVSPTLAE
jgi:hypothetical protein